MALTSVVPSYTIGMSGDIIPNNFDMMPYSTFHTALLPHPNPIELGNAANISTGLMLATQQPTGQNPYCPPITLTNGYYTNATYPNNAESFCYVQSNDANSLLNAYHTYPTSMNLPLHATNISCDKLYTSSNHINNNSTAQNALLPTVNTNHITMNNNNNNKSELTNRLEIITIEKSNSLLDDSSNGIIDKSTTVSSSSSSSTTTTTTITTHGENVQHNTSLLVLRLLMSGKEVGSIIGKRGENVRKYREESGARINISDGSSPERIVTITGTTEQIYVAFTLMSRKFEDDFTQGLLRMGDETVNCPPVTLRLLVPVAQCGSIIGKGGSKIKDVRELTGASIQVASEALPTSTERTVTISGTADAISKCIQLLCDIFLECPNKGPVVLYRPKPVILNPGLMCPSSTFSSGLLHSNLSGLPLSMCENTHESGYTTPMFTSASLLSNEVNSVSPTPLNRTYTNQFGMPSGILSGSTAGVGSCNIGCGVSNTSIVPNLPTQNTIQSPLTVIGSGRPVNQMSDLIADQVHLFTTLNQLDFANFQSYFSSILAPLPTGNPLTAGVHSIGQPLSIPEIALTPSLLGCYPTAPAATALPIVGSPNNYMFSTPATLLKISSRLPEDQFTTSISNSFSDIVGSQSEMCMNNGKNISPSDSSISNGTLPVGSMNNYTPLSAHLDPIKSIHGLQNTSSLLGLPSLSVGTVLHPQQQNSLFSLANTEENVVVREMIISNDVIGCIIGRGGTTINEIRNASKAQIKISNCEDGAKERKITVTGKLDSVNLAQFLINSSIAIHQEMWAFNVRLASAATALMTKNDLNVNSSIKQHSEIDEESYTSPLNDTINSHIDYSLLNQIYQ
ncbi:Poly(rC)-binding protein isoform 2 [Schistosoma japonicum]|uniref:Poly(RC)-binding protein isoform 2 n=2 Tax=Schistosoma japonicum TaxID=6182 RepID=A0A4Z2DL45_SCHJA|nr:Poly(rC)-binding protein isoform 2 [Schistosoma japonicum]